MHDAALMNDSTCLSDERFDELSLRYLDGLLTPEELAEFGTRLRQEERCRDGFVNLCIQTSLLLEHTEDEISCVPNWPVNGQRSASSTAVPKLNVAGDWRVFGFLKSLAAWIFSSLFARPAESRRQI